MTDSKNVPSTGVQEIDKEIFEWHNNLRKDPKILIDDLEQMLD